MTKFAKTRSNGGSRLRPVWLRRGDIAAACAVLVTALLTAFFLWFGQAPASQVSVQYPDGHKEYISLNRVQTIEISGNNGIDLLIEIDNGRARVRESSCPDQVCVHSGWLSRSGQTAACVPAGVCVQILGGEPAVDGVTA